MTVLYSIRTPYATDVHRIVRINIRGGTGAYKSGKVMYIDKLLI
jgi:hypothetical protein